MAYNISILNDANKEIIGTGENTIANLETSVSLSSYTPGPAPGYYDNDRTFYHYLYYNGVDYFYPLTNPFTYGLTISSLPKSQYLSLNYAPMFAINNSSNIPVSSYGYNLDSSGTDFKVWSLAESATSFNMAAVTTNILNSISYVGNCGLSVFNSAGDPTFDSRARQFNIVDIVNATCDWSGSAQWVTHRQVPGTPYLIFISPYRRLLWNGLWNGMYVDFPKTRELQGVYGQTTTGFYLKKFTAQTGYLWSGNPTSSIDLQGGDQLTIIVGYIST